MGGSAFAQAAAPGQLTLNTPRMTRVEYASVKETYLSRLQDYFLGKTVQVLIEAPEKTDYGDIDLIVELDDKVDTIDLARRLGARGVICSSSGKHQMCSIAVLKDGSRSTQEAVVYKHSQSNNPRKVQPSTTPTKEEYAQIDIQIVPSEDFHWHGFYCSYGDLGGLIGNITRNLGFTVTDKGLVLRLKELDYAKKQNFGQVADKDGMLWLSNDPDRVMKFLGLSSNKYAEGFTTVEDLFKWVGECRLIDLDLIRKKRNISRDRQKENKRTLYSTFFHEWLPKKCEMQDDEADSHNESKDLDEKDVRHEDQLWSRKRDELCEEAIEFFDKQGIYSNMLNNLRKSILNLWAERLLKPIIANHSAAKDKKLAEIMRAFRRRVGFKGSRCTEPYIVAEPHSDANSQLYWLFKDTDFLHRCNDDAPEFAHWDVIDIFVRSHWEELKKLERERAKAARETQVHSTT